MTSKYQSMVDAFDEAEATQSGTGQAVVDELAAPGMAPMASGTIPDPDEEDADLAGWLDETTIPTTAVYPCSCGLRFEVGIDDEGRVLHRTCPLCRGPLGWLRRAWVRWRRLAGRGGR